MKAWRNPDGTIRVTSADEPVPDGAVELDPTTALDDRLAEMDALVAKAAVRQAKRRTKREAAKAIQVEEDVAALTDADIPEEVARRIISRGGP